MAEAYSLPFARINPKLSDPKVIDVLPEDFLEKQCVLPLFLMKGTLALAVHEPTNVFVREEVERMTGHSVQLVAAATKNIVATLRRDGLNKVKAKITTIKELFDASAI